MGPPTPNLAGKTGATVCPVRNVRRYGNAHIPETGVGDNAFFESLGAEASDEP